MREQGAKAPEAIEAALTNDLFVPEDFEQLVLEAAANNSSVGKLLIELQEPRPAGHDCIPWLDETAMKERIVRLCANGKVAINLRGMEYLQAQSGEDEENAWRRLRAKLSHTGRQLDEVFLLPPSAVPATGGINPQPSPGLPPLADSLARALGQRQRLWAEHQVIQEQNRELRPLIQILVTAFLAEALGHRAFRMPRLRPRHST